MTEPFWGTLTRTTLAALVLGGAFLLALPRHGALAVDFVDAFSVAFCFTFLGHYIDALLDAVPEIGTGVGHVVRVAGRFAGGLWCYVVARWLWMKVGRDLNDLPGLAWGGVFLLALEPVMKRAAARHPE
ncbi:MAG TPA: hypothetical protein VEU55_09285 [Gemmatimonadales bacterium]|nr:hypothetical protein [Gemmatimonadales bacterium]